MSARVTRSKAPAKEKTATSKRRGIQSKTTTNRDATADIEDVVAAGNGAEDSFNKKRDASDEEESLDSDALDEEDLEVITSRKRKRTASVSKKSPAHGKQSSAKRGRTSSQKKQKTMPDDGDEDDFQLGDGQEVVGVVVQAPKTGRVPPGQISKNTLNFLSELRKPECNDREWCVRNIEPVYRLAEGEWKAFIEHFTDCLVDVDPQIPHLPPKDVIHRIYRDVRFSNDKTPYKTGFSASFSRSGRKGIFAGCKYGHRRNTGIISSDALHLKSGGESLIAAGTWCPGKNEIQTIRNNLLRSSRRLRQIISAPEFEALFGPAQPHPKGERQNVFGFDDELKVAPKGVEKTHKDIDLLKCRSFAVVHKFTDTQVLSPDFKDELARVALIMRPFVHGLNDLMTLENADSSDSEDDEAHDDEELADGGGASDED
ncbi:hypothetical protein BC628DRAFT_1308413 [Trametes gibbosa]|nr:hypothetical protein BC628DRAFT_1308413 [Trametes gibbosa]